jgi:hypothetical protein
VLLLSGIINELLVNLNVEETIESPACDFAATDEAVILFS